ncbi:MAG: hypothetical protein GYB68_11885 [Chloroflexi bacterium]|nr:hypothetical protein [Chloroflexota bacterium]
MAEVQAIPQEHEQEHGDVLYCSVHPSAETSLRCNKCGRPMCTKCAVKTPVGYRCKECVAGQQKTFYNAESQDIFIQGAIALSLGFVGAGLLMGILSFIGFFGWFIAFFVSPGIGAGIADLAHRAVDKRRSRYGWLVVAGGIVLSGLLAIGALWLFWFSNPIVSLIYLVAATGGAVGRLRVTGGRIRL